LNIHNHNAARVVMVVLISTCHTNFSSHYLSVQLAVEVKNIDRLITHNEATKMVSQIFNVFTTTNVSEKITTDDSGLGLAQAFHRSRTRV